MPLVPENKAVCFICILYVFVMCIFVLIFNNKDKIMSKYPPYFIFCNLERICLCNGEIILAALLRQNSKINMTKNREIVIFLKKNSDMIFLPYLPPLL